MHWRRLTLLEARALHDVRAPGALLTSLHLAAEDGWTLWAYKVSPRDLLSHGNGFLFWVRRDSDSMEWSGGGSPLAGAKVAAEAKLAKVRGGTGS